MTIVHIVLFEFKPTIGHEVIQNVCKQMLALRLTCIHPTTNRPYILESTGGRDHSPEGHQVGGFTHGFVSHFANEEDRNYYVNTDPAHKAFVESLAGIIENARVVDYTPGIY